MEHSKSDGDLQSQTVLIKDMEPSSQVDIGIYDSSAAKSSSMAGDDIQVVKMGELFMDQAHDGKIKHNQSDLTLESK